MNVYRHSERIKVLATSRECLQTPGVCLWWVYVMRYLFCGEGERWTLKNTSMRSIFNPKFEDEAGPSFVAFNLLHEFSVVLLGTDATIMPLNAVAVLMQNIE